MAIKRITAPMQEPLALEDIKTQCRIIGSDEDALLIAIGEAARAHVENVTGRTFVNSQFQLVLNCFPLGSIELPEPVIAVSGIDYLDADGNTQTIAGALLDVEDGEIAPRLRMADGSAWPQTAARFNAVRVNYSAGWIDANAVPQPIKHAILLVAGHLYENREQTTEKALAEIPIGVDALISRYAIKRLA